MAYGARLRVGGMGRMGRDEFLDYCEAQAKTERCAFTSENMARLHALAGDSESALQFEKVKMVHACTAILIQGLVDRAREMWAGVEVQGRLVDELPHDFMSRGPFQLEEGTIVAKAGDTLIVEAHTDEPLDLMPLLIVRLLSGGISFRHVGLECPLCDWYCVTHNWAGQPEKRFRLHAERCHGAKPLVPVHVA